MRMGKVLLGTKFPPQMGGLHAMGRNMEILRFFRLHLSGKCLATCCPYFVPKGTFWLAFGCESTNILSPRGQVMRIPGISWGEKIQKKGAQFASNTSYFQSFHGRGKQVKAPRPQKGNGGEGSRFCGRDRSGSPHGARHAATEDYKRIARPAAPLSLCGMQERMDGLRQTGDELVHGTFVDAGIPQNKALLLDLPHIAFAEGMGVYAFGFQGVDQG
jgi:hypothetical protein